MRGEEFPPGWKTVEEIIAETDARRVVEEVKSARVGEEHFVVIEASARTKLPDGRTHQHATTIRYYTAPKFFLKALTENPLVLPAWRVFTPWGREGAVYYVVEDNKGVKHVFRATYGYYGTGPHQAAEIEVFIKKTLPGLFENRDGDYLLSALGLI